MFKFSMRRNLLLASSALLLALCLAIGALWARSLSIQDPWGWNNHRQNFSILSSKGILEFWFESRLQLPTKQFGLYHHTTTAIDETFSDWVEMTIERNWFWHGFGVMISHEAVGDPPTKFVSVAIPDWFLIVLLLAILGLWVKLFAIKRPSSVWPTCSKCGYDIRASNERCPECGTLVKNTQCEPTA
jgi:hypothetical protein